MDESLLADLLERFLMPARPGEVIEEVVRAHADERLTAWDLAPILAAHPHHAQALLAQPAVASRIKGWVQEDPSLAERQIDALPRALALFGKSVTRSMVICLRLNEVSGVVVKEGQAPPIEPKRKLPRALAAEEYCLEQRWVHPEAAYLGGLHYDWLAAVLEGRRGSREARAALDEAFADGFRLAQYAYEIVGQLGAVRHSRLVFAAGMALPLGRVFMAHHHPKGGAGLAWSKFTADMAKLGAARPLVERVLEQRAFPVTQAEFTGLWVRAMGLLNEVEPAIRHGHEPWMLLEIDPDLHRLAMVFSVALTLAAGPAPKEGGELALERYQRQWLAKHRVPESRLRDALAKLEPPPRVTSG
jgi:hypothetical protein